MVPEIQEIDKRLSSELEVYQLASSIFLTYSSNKNTKGVRHTDKKIEENLKILNAHRFFKLSKEQFMLYCTNYILYNVPTSLTDFFVRITRDDIKNVIREQPIKKDFDNMILYFNNDLRYIKNMYSNYNFRYFFNEYIKKKIKFTSVYFYIEHISKTNPDILKEINKSRIYKSLYKVINGIMLIYLNFNKDKKKQIQNDIKKVKEINGL